MRGGLRRHLSEGIVAVIRDDIAGDITAIYQYQCIQGTRLDLPTHAVIGLSNAEVLGAVNALGGGGIEGITVMVGDGDGRAGIQWSGQAGRACRRCHRLHW